MEMPRPTADHARLARLAGNWIGEESMHPTPFLPGGGTAVGRMQARMDLDGFYLIADYQQERNGVVNFRGHGVFGWDPRGKCYTMRWFDSIGIEQEPSLGSWEGDTLTLQHEIPHMQCHSRYVYTVGDGEYRLRVENSTDCNTWTPFLEGVYHRVEPEAAVLA